MIHLTVWDFGWQRAKPATVAARRGRAYPLFVAWDIQRQCQILPLSKARLDPQ